MPIRVAIVTGSNKGIGFGTVRGLSKKFEGDVYLTAPNSDLGLAAVDELKKEGCHVLFHQLDINETNSIEGIRDEDFMKDKYGGIDVLVNNAGIMFAVDAKEHMGVQAEVTCRTNYWSTKSVCDILFPILKPGARVVNVSSSAGKVANMKDSPIKAKFISSGNALTVKELNEMMTQFVESAKDGTHEEKGFKNTAYGMSKVGLSALTRIQQQDFDKTPDTDCVANHVHPGYVKTDMNNHKGPLSIDEGARSSIYAALLPPNTDIRGKYIWEDCSVKDWVTFA